MKKKLLFLSFIEGAAVMAAELCGAKLLAPVFGSSLYVWASVMGITLLALALGYFYGGSISRKQDKNTTNLFYVLSAAALFMLLMPLISYYLIQRISYLPFMPGVVISTTTLLFLPVFFLGASSPLFISIQSTDEHSAGKVSGTVYAVSTLGGIFSTFLCGFYLIPEIGLNSCLLIFGSILFLMNALILRKIKAGLLLVFISFIYLSLQIKISKDLLFSSDSILGHLEIKDLDDKINEYRILSINAIIQSEMDLKSKKSRSTYLKIIDSLTAVTSTQKNALVLGLGAGLSSNLLIRKGYRTEAVEFDERIIAAAKKYFYLDERVKTYCDDARCYLNKCSKKYDLILVDVFKAEEQPSHVLTQESLIKLKENLNDSAVVLINWHGYLKSNRGLGTRILINTLKHEGFDVKICSDSDKEDQRNLIFVASLHPLTKLPFELNDAIDITDLLNTDDKPLLEKYNAEANKTWRLSYLRYYQQMNNNLLHN